jgi:hypothetical protein
MKNENSNRRNVIKKLVWAACLEASGFRRWFNQ